MKTFYRLHSVNETGSLSESAMTIKQLATMVLRRLQDNLVSLRLVWLELNEEGTMGVRRLNEVKIRRPFRRARSFFS